MHSSTSLNSPQWAPDAKLQAYIERNVYHNPFTGCWYWLGRIGDDGYGFLPENMKSRRTHLASYEAYTGPIPEGMVIMHGCDHRQCVNPAHLIIGTKYENAWDMLRKNRQHTRGTRLTPDMVQGIRDDLRSGMNRAAIMAKWGEISDGTYRRVIDGSHPNCREQGPVFHTVALPFEQCYAVSESGCWEWCNEGFSYTHEGRRLKADRYSYLKANGQSPSIIAHTCANRRCVNPDHLVDQKQVLQSVQVVQKSGWHIGYESALAMRSEYASLEERFGDRIAVMMLCRRYGTCADTVRRNLVGQSNAKPPSERREPLADRILRHCIPEPNSGCWLWTGVTKGPNGAGEVVVNGNKTAAHRASYMAFVDAALPKGAHVRHACGNPLCVNPVHLWLAHKG